MDMYMLDFFEITTFYIEIKTFKMDKMSKITLNQVFNTYDEFKDAFEAYAKATYTLWATKSSVYFTGTKNYKFKELQCVSWCRFIKILHNRC